MPIQDRVEAAARRLGVRIKDNTQKVALPSLSVAQVRRLLDLYPVRLLEPGESVDAYRHYCGAAALVQLLAASCKSEEGVSLELEDEELTAEAVGRAIAARNGTEYIED
jgi:hypothetical protein